METIFQPFLQLFGFTECVEYVSINTNVINMPIDTEEKQPQNNCSLYELRLRILLDLDCECYGNLSSNDDDINEILTDSLFWNIKGLFSTYTKISSKQEYVDIVYNNNIINDVTYTDDEMEYIFSECLRVSHFFAKNILDTISVYDEVPGELLDKLSNMLEETYGN